MTLIKDLGMLYPTKTSKQKSHYGLYKCPKCKGIDKVNMYQVRSLCKVCLGHSKGRIKAIRDTDEPLYTVWRNMLDRCNTVYKNRGITVCKEWAEDKQAFIDWAKANGYVKGLHLDKDELSVLKGILPPIYSPETCQFVTTERNQAIRKELGPVYMYLATLGLKYLSSLKVNK